jgi:beta-galactosidase
MNWPCINSHFGIIDIAGFPKDSVGYYRANWAGACDEVWTSPSHWTSPIPAGTSMTVTVFACAGFAQLYVNGQAQSASGPVPVPALGYASFSGVTYTPGNLTAVAYAPDGVTVVATRTLLTAGQPVALRMWVESPYNAPRNGSIIAADGQDTTLIGVEVIDANGLRYPVNPGVNVTFAVASGPGAVYGVANGDPSDHSPDHASWRLTFGGVARAIIASSGAGQTGSITVTASAAGLQPASVTLTAQ